MKILFIKEKRGKDGFEGIASYLFNVCKTLNKLNIQYLILYNSNDKYYRKLKNNNINVRLIKLPSKSPKNLFHDYLKVIKCRKEIKKIVEREKITHINLHFPHLLWYLDKSIKLPIITHQHSAFVNNERLKNFYFKDIFNPFKLLRSFYQKNKVFNFRMSNLIICPSKASKKTTELRFGADKKKILVNVYGCSEQDISKVKDIKKKLGFDKKDKIVLSVGRETKSKGVEDFCAVAKTLYKTNYKFLFLGGYKDRDYHNYLIKKYDKYVYFLGMKENIDEYFKMSDLKLFLSHREGGPIALYEAMQFRLPIIVWNTIGVNEVVKHGHNGYCCPIGNINKVTHKVRLILENEGLHKRLSSNSYDYFYKKYNFKDHVDRLLLSFSNLK